MRASELSGLRVGMLTVVSRNGSSPDGRSVWLCQCDCGNVKEVAAAKLTRKVDPTRSCGCLRGDNFGSGVTSTHTYRCWVRMRARCSTNRKQLRPRYAGRGIRVCKQWAKSFAQFANDMGEAPTPKHSIERIDNDGDYSPDNCRWATHVEQCRNRSNSRLHTFNGKTKTQAEWAEEYQINQSLLSQRVSRGWNFQRALTTPVKGK